jgi:outer membrane protein OmpA-like peptidoglycan-associated protein
MQIFAFSLWSRRPYMNLWFWLLCGATIVALVSGAGSVSAQIAATERVLQSLGTGSEPPLTSANELRTADLKAMLARVKRRLTAQWGGDPTASSRPDTADRIGTPPQTRMASDVSESPSGLPLQFQRDLQTLRSLQAALARELGETRDGRKIDDRRSADLREEVANLRAIVVNATNEIKALRDQLLTLACESRQVPSGGHDQRAGTAAQLMPPDLAMGPCPQDSVANRTDADAPLPPPATARDDSKEVAEEEVIARLNGSVFRPGSAQLQPRAASQLAGAGRFIGSHPTMQVRIVGHTDASGDDQRNLELSARRADAVRDYLANEFRLPVTRMLAEGKGEVEPIASNETPAGRQANRRVEIRVRP